MDIIKFDTNIMAADWSSATNRLAVLANNEKKIREKWEETSMLANVTIFDIQQDKNALISTKLGRSKDHICCMVKWAHNGHLFVVGDTKNRNPANQGKFFIYLIRTVITKVEIQNQGKKKGKKGKTQFQEKKDFVIDSVEDIDIPKADTLLWDPTARYFATTRLPKGGKYLYIKHHTI